MLRPRGNPQNWWFWWRTVPAHCSSFVATHQSVFPSLLCSVFGVAPQFGDLHALPRFVVYWSFSSAAAPGHSAGILHECRSKNCRMLWLQRCRGCSHHSWTLGASISCRSCDITVQTCPVHRLLKAFAAQEGNFVGKSPSLVTTCSWRISSNGVIGLECGFLAFLLKLPLLLS